MQKNMVGEECDEDWIKGGWGEQVNLTVLVVMM